ncbi:TPA: ABC-2 family transporter protein [Streptococcus suis]
MNVLAYTIAEFRRRKSYRVSTILTILGAFLIVAIQISVWTSVVTENTSSQLVLYAVISRMMFILFPDHRIASIISEMIQKGDTAVYFLRPHSFMGMHFFRQVGSFVYDLIFVVTPLTFALVFYSFVSGISLIPEMVLSFIMSALLGLLISFLFGYLLGLLSIRFNQILGVLEFYDALLMLFGGSVLPISFFPEMLQKLIVLTPFYAMLSVPSSILSALLPAQYVVQQLCLQMFWVLLLALFISMYQKKLFKVMNYYGG